MRAFLGPKYREIHDQSLDITCMMEFRWVGYDIPAELSPSCLAGYYVFVFLSKLRFGFY